MPEAAISIICPSKATPLTFLTRFFWNLLYFAKSSHETVVTTVRHVSPPSSTSSSALLLLSSAVLANGHYAFAAFLLLYILLFFLLPLALLSKLLTEAGVYAFLLSSVLYIGRCVLRLLAFPGTNVKVYGEIEVEFAKYSCRLLDGVGEALAVYANCVIVSCADDGDSAGGNSAGSDSSGDVKKKKKIAQLTEGEPQQQRQRYAVSDLPTAHKRAIEYINRVISVYHQVLHCLIEDGGVGPRTRQSTDGNAAGSSNNSFYGREMVHVCKRNLCCGTTTADATGNNGGDGNYHVHDNDTNAANIMVSSSTDNNTMTNQYSNNTLMGDIGNMMNLTPEARSDGRELYELLTCILRDITHLSKFASNILQNIGKVPLKGTVSEDVTQQSAGAG